MSRIWVWLGTVNLFLGLVPFMPWHMGLNFAAAYMAFGWALTEGKRGGK